MLQSQLFSRTLHQDPKDEPSVNARLLSRAGYVDKLMAGVWTYLPLGWRVLSNINNIIREEMDRIGAVEMHMPALQPKELWEATNRWGGQEIMYQFQDHGGRDVGLAWTHEELVAAIAKRAIASYRDLPLAVYQIQSKFRDEPRAKAGILRGREFFMKDLYSFHTTEEEQDEFYNSVRQAYRNIFTRCGVDAREVEASGGAFTDKFSHEYQVVTESGEDSIVYCQSCTFARNSEVAEGTEKCPNCDGALTRAKSIEVGNIFKLGKRFPEAYDLKYKDANGKDQYPLMASYGIGPGRLMGTIVEVLSDEKGIIWPREVAPALVHLIPVGASGTVTMEARGLYERLHAARVTTLLDDRADVSAGERFADADLLGLPFRVVVSEKTLKEGKYELKHRSGGEAQLVDFDTLISLISS